MTTKKRKTPPHARPRPLRAKVDSGVRTVIVDEELESPADNDRDTDEELIADDFDGPKTVQGYFLTEEDSAGQRDHGELTVTEPALNPDMPQPSPSSDRRLTPTLLRIFARRRKEIGVSIEQVARLTGIPHATLERYESDEPGQAISFDQVVVLSRVLGLTPDALPGMRRRETRVPLDATLIELERTLLGAPLLRFEGSHGERFGGDVERAAASKVFTVRIDDNSLLPALQRGALLGFVSQAKPRAGGVLLLRHRKSSMLTMRRFEPPIYAGILPWQPSYPVGGEWHLCGALEVMMPPR